MKILSIDFDYFQNTTKETLLSDYPDGIDLPPFVSQVVWASRYIDENSEKEAKQFLEDIFGDEDIDNVNDELKALIKDYVTTLLEGDV